MSYDDLDEPTSTLITEKIFSKFCFFGIVTSKNWDLTFLVVLEGVLRLYDSEETYLQGPENFVYQVVLKREHLASTMYVKNYAKNEAMEPVMIHYIYLLQDNGLWSPTRLLKIGSLDVNVIKRITNAIKQATR